MSVELVHIYRNNNIESIHRGDVVAVKNNNIIFSYGDPYKRTFWRSAAKPFQVIPFLEAGGYKSFNLEEHELALMTSSHGGEVEHVKTVRAILAKMNQTESILDCGPSQPMYNKAYKEMLVQNIDISSCNNPCSGKHSGMIGLGLLENISLENYINKDHAIQLRMLDIIAKYTEMNSKDIDIAIDGCGVPVFGLPIYNMALAYEKLAQDDLKIIKDAMINHPYYVAGTRRLDTILMEETNGKILAKLGAEAVYSMTILNEGIGVAVKIECGTYRALDALIPALLRKHEYISNEEFQAIQARLKLDILNHRKEIVGRYEVTL